MAVSANRLELLQIADAVAQVRGFRESVRRRRPAGVGLPPATFDDTEEVAYERAGV